MSNRAATTQAISRAEQQRALHLGLLSFLVVLSTSQELAIRDKLGL